MAFDLSVKHGNPYHSTTAPSKGNSFQRQVELRTLTPGNEKLSNENEYQGYSSNEVRKDVLLFIQAYCFSAYQRRLDLCSNSAL
jgi:hypothetical protein